MENDRAKKKEARRRRKQRRRRLVGMLFRTVLRGIQLCPESLWRCLVTPLAPLLIPPRLQRVARAQLASALGDRLDARERRGIQRRLGRQWGRMVKEVADYWRGDLAYIQRMVRPHESFERHMRAARDHGAGTGVILTTPHFGNFELMPGWGYGVGGYAGIVLAKRVVNPHIDGLIVEARRFYNVETVYTDESPRKLLRVLARGDIVGILPDQDISRLPGVFVDFLGRQAYTLSGPANLAILSGASILPAYMLWCGDHYELRAEEPIHVDASAEREAEVLRITCAWTRAFERIIMSHPDHWVWYHERWRTTPEILDQRRKSGRLRRKR